MTVSRTEKLDGSFLCTGFPYDVREHGDDYLGYFKAFITHSFALRRPGSAVLDLCYVRCGPLRWVLGDEASPLGCGCCESDGYRSKGESDGF